MRSQVHEGCVVACAMKRKLAQSMFNAANDAVEQALSKTSLAELVRGRRLNLPKLIVSTHEGALMLKRSQARRC